MLPVGNYTQVCTPNSWQISVSSFAPCCLWPGVGTMGWYLCPYRCWCQSNPSCVIKPGVKRNPTLFLPRSDISRMLFFPLLPPRAPWGSHFSFPSCLLRGPFPSLPPIPPCSLVGDGAQGVKPHKLSHHCYHPVAPLGTCISFSALSWTNKTQLLPSGRVNQAPPQFPITHHLKYTVCLPAPWGVIAIIYTIHWYIKATVYLSNTSNSF